MMLYFGLCLLCLAVPTVISESDHTAHRNNLKHSAIRILAWAEEDGGKIINEVILGKHDENGIIFYDAAIMNDLMVYVQHLHNEVTSLTELASDTSYLLLKRVQLESPEDLILPDGVNRHDLDFNDILDIIGDYTKGFMEIMEPVVQTFSREMTVQEMLQLVDGIIRQLEELSAQVF